MKPPNFDDVDLGIICIAVILIIISIALIFSDQINAGLGVIGGGITAIATLAGRRIKNNSNNGEDNGINNEKK